MGMTMTIEDFNTRLTSEKEDSPLMKALRQLTAVEKLEDIIVTLAQDEVPWTR